MTFSRQQQAAVIQAFCRSPAVALLGPRQVGKTTWALAVGQAMQSQSASLYLAWNLMLLSRLQPWHVNVGKRLVRSPKLYVCDSGLLQALLGIADEEAVLSHPVVGPAARPG